MQDFEIILGNGNIKDNNFNAQNKKKSLNQNNGKCQQSNNTNQNASNNFTNSISNRTSTVLMKSHDGDVLKGFPTIIKSNNFESA